MKIFYPIRKFQRYHSSKVLKDYDMQNLAGLSVDKLPKSCKSITINFNTRNQLDINVKFHSYEHILGTIKGEIRRIQETIDSRGDISSGYVYYNMFMQYYRDTFAVKFFNENEFYKKFYRYFIKQFGDYSQLRNKATEIAVKSYKELLTGLTEFRDKQILDKILILEDIIQKELPIFETIEFYVPYTKDIKIQEVFEEWTVNDNSGIIVLEKEDLSEENLKLNAVQYYKFMKSYYMNNITGMPRIIYLNKATYNLTTKDIIDKYKKLYKDDVIDYTKFSYINNVLYKDKNSRDMAEQEEIDVDFISHKFNIDKNLVKAYDSILYHVTDIEEQKSINISDGLYKISPIPNLNSVLPKILKDWEKERMAYLAEMFDTPHLTKELRLRICEFRYNYKEAVGQFSDGTLLPTIVVDLQPSVEIMKRLENAINYNIIIDFNEARFKNETSVNYIVRKVVHNLIDYVLKDGLELPAPKTALQEEYKKEEKEANIKPITVNSTIEEIIEYSNATKVVLNPVKGMAFAYINDFIRCEEKSDNFYNDILKKVYPNA